MLPPELSEALLCPVCSGGSISFLGVSLGRKRCRRSNAVPIGFSKKKSTVLPAKYGAFLVENSGIEPLTSCMPCKRSPEPP